jgi:retron-type reverse transcriptase
MYQVSYEKIKRKAGQNSAAVDSETMDGISIAWLSETISQLRIGTFQFRKGGRFHIPKSSGKGTRPLTIGSPRDKVIQEVVFPTTRST